jgi:23S rRNA (guanine745-N1)-methyltransferase
MQNLRCPLCRLPLIQNAQGVACNNRHQFDRAKEGYLNLLPVQNKHSREPGDAKEQLQARRRFMQAGYFASLKERLQSLLPSATNTLLDIGCGEGYFTAGLAESLSHASVYGIDIAKAGVRLAAKSAQENPRLTYCVASSFDLPLVDQSMDVITRIYAPSKDSELYRVIKPDGIVIIVTPGERHLWALRTNIYSEVRPHPEPQAPEQFKAVAQHQLIGDLCINDPDLCMSLLAMTPFAWRLPIDTQLALATKGIKDVFDFKISVYKRE